MKLTDSELNEIMMLRAYQKSSRYPMSQEQFDRLKYLRWKEVHNCCSNPQCIGYEGEDHEFVCPYCKHRLFKITSPTGDK